MHLNQDEGRNPTILEWAVIIASLFLIGFGSGYALCNSHNKVEIKVKVEDAQGGKL